MTALPALPLPPTLAERQRVALADPLVAAAWATFKPIRDPRDDVRLISPLELKPALAAAIEKQAAIMRRDHADAVLIAEYDRLAGELRRGS